MSKPEMFSDGQAYERMMGRWSRVVGHSFLDWIAVPPGLRWLDVGCGNGAFTEELIARCAPSAVAAVDPSEGQLAYARTRPGTKVAEFRIGDAQALPFANSSFEVVVMALVISFVSDPAKAVAEMLRVARPGGWVATYMWDFEADGSPNGPFSRAAKSLGMIPPSPPTPLASRRDAMQELWRAAGFESIETRVIRIPVEFASFDELWDTNSVPVGPSGTWVHSLAPAVREQLRAQMREQLPTAADGRIVYEACANVVKGRVPA